jgi:UDP-N-acetyl-D-mannosaminuronic acid dehydrogenase
MIQLARRINDGMPGHLVELTEEALAEAGVKLAGARAAVLGVAYLENSDDTRNTPAVPLIRELLARGAEVVAHDPYVRQEEWLQVSGSMFQVPLTRDLAEALRGADAAVIVTRHQEYVDLANQTMGEQTANPQSPSRNPKFEVWRLMRTPTLVDGRNVFDDKACRQNGITYRGIGKGMRSMSPRWTLEGQPRGVDG